MNFGTVTATYLDPDGQPATGSVTLTPEGDVCDSFVTIVSRPVTTQVVAGSASAVVETTGTSLYRIDERLDGVSVVTWVAPMPVGLVDLSALREQYVQQDFG